MSRVYDQLDAADAIAIATPVFFATVPAVLKMLMDRCQPYWARRHVLHEPPPAVRRPGAILVVGGGGDPFGTGCALNPIKSVFAVLSVSADRVIEVVGPDRLGDIVAEPDALTRAEQAGRDLVGEVRIRA
jgi:NAD(P)H-dependent FMN reductase